MNYLDALRPDESSKPEELPDTVRRPQRVQRHAYEVDVAAGKLGFGCFKRGDMQVHACAQKSAQLQNLALRAGVFRKSIGYPQHARRWHAQTVIFQDA